MTPNYKVLTSKSVLDIPFDENHETEMGNLIREQESMYDCDTHTIHFFDSAFFNESTEEMTINDAIECLAIKDGVDLVQFENGNKGFVAYYNTHENGFEIIKGEQK